MERRRDAHAEFFAAPMILGTWDDMHSNYIAEIKAGARRAITILPYSMRIDRFQAQLTHSVIQ